MITSSDPGHMRFSCGSGRFSQLWTGVIVGGKGRRKGLTKLLKVRRSLQKELPDSRKRAWAESATSTSLKEERFRRIFCLANQIKHPRWRKCPRFSCLLRKKVPAARRGVFILRRPFSRMHYVVKKRQSRGGAFARRRTTLCTCPRLHPSTPSRSLNDQAFFLRRVAHCCRFASGAASLPTAVIKEASLCVASRMSK